ncbi:M48 family metalloprotease [Propionivibrio limicola]|uniref:M48 family metalloprotease n=1 Tax=Propionivibrio limicola TaxID=167645 RepID=UPI00129217DB
MLSERWQRHAWSNRLQTALLIGAMLGIGALAGYLLTGPDGLWVALVASAIALLVEPSTARLTLRLYRARPIHPHAAPGLWRLMEEIAGRAELPAVPELYYVPSPFINAFTVGNRRESAIALTHGLLEQLTPREIAGVLAHETAHIAHGDLRVMGLADYVSRLTSVFALLGQFMILFSLPLWASGEGEINWPAFLLLVFAPHLAMLSQLGLSRVREFDADLTAAALTGDPRGLASALARIERGSRSWRSLLMPGWGNPEPSWLRTHPATEERIRRLLELAPEGDRLDAGMERTLYEPGALASRVRSHPRWTIGGLWH